MLCQDQELELDVSRRIAWQGFQRAATLKSTFDAALISTVTKQKSPRAEIRANILKERQLDQKAHEIRALGVKFSQQIMIHTYNCALSPTNLRCFRL